MKGDVHLVAMSYFTTHGERVLGYQQSQPELSRSSDGIRRGSGGAQYHGHVGHVSVEADEADVVAHSEEHVLF